jgi:hypothetical protein
MAPAPSKFDETFMSSGNSLDVSGMGDLPGMKGFDDISAISFPGTPGGQGEHFNSPATGGKASDAYNKLQSTAYRFGPSREGSAAEPFPLTPKERSEKHSFSSFGSVAEGNMGSNFATQSTVMDYMHNKGLLRHLIEALPLGDDQSLMELFSKTPGTVHMRSLLIFEAKMFMLSRFAKTGVGATMILLEDNLILKLADMRVFKLGGYLNGQSPLDECEMSMMMERPASAEPTIALTVAQQTSQMESLITAVLGLFHSMVSSAPKNSDVVAQASVFQIYLLISLVQMTVP